MTTFNATGPDAPNLPPCEDPAKAPAKPQPIDPPREEPPVKLPPEPAPQP